MKKSVRVTAIAAALALAMTAVAAVPASAKTPTTGKLGITVTAPGGIPIPHVKVVVTAKAVTNPGGAAEGDSDSTNINGRVVTPELAPGTYTVTATLAAPVKVTQTVETTITADVNSQLSIVLPGVQYITGTVTAHGEPAHGRVNATDGKNAYGVGTLADGTYKILVKPGVSYTVVARPSVDNTDWLSTYAGDTVRKPDARAITPSASAPSTVNIAAYDRVGTIRGRILTPSGKLAPDVRVTACAINRSRCVTTQSNSEGAFAARGLPAGEYEITAYSRTAGGYADGLRVRAGSTTRTDITIRKPATGTGKVLLTLSAPSAMVRAGAACASLRDADGFSQGWDCLEPGERKMVFTGLDAGTYTVVLDGANVAKTVKVVQDQTTLISMTCPAGTALTGKVRTSTGAAAENVQVTVRDGYGMFLGYSMTDANGSYRIPYATSGAYQIWASPRGTSSDVFTTRKVTLSGSNPTVNLTLEKPATLTGKIVNSAGKPVAGMVVVLDNNTYLTTKTNAKGEYVLRGARAGTYRLYAYDNYEGGYVDTLSSTVTTTAGGTRAVPTITVKD